ncbi:MAG: methyltransferase, TrmH family, group 3 [Clostridiales bacterium]|nr:methyltransferase, TrmH family, group 3 [Clostridiales bacterium]
MQTITSSQNPVIKEIKSLKIRKNREEKQLFFIEGIRFVEEALKEGVAIETILFSDRLYETRGGEDIISQIREGDYETYHLPDKLFQEISDTENPQGIIAVVKMKQYKLEEIIDEGDFFLILDSLQDPGNMGTIIRTADAAGVTGIIISRGCVDIYNPKVLRSTMGSIFHIPFCFSESLPEAIRQLKEQGIKVFAAHLDGKLNYFDADMKCGTAIIIGNEANGISQETAEQSDSFVKIPMPGRSESLNASVAASLLMYEVVRQRFND